LTHYFAGEVGAVINTTISLYSHATLRLRNDEQVIILYAVSNGLLDDIEVNQVSDFEKSLFEYTQTSASSLVEALQKGEWSDDSEAQIKKVVEDYKATRN